MYLCSVLIKITKNIMNTQEIVFEKNNMQVVKEGKKFFTRIFENGESFESGDFNTLKKAKENLGISPTIEENNKLIAEFLHGKNAVHPNQYHENWNELMQVVEKIESLGYRVNIELYSCVIEPNDKRELFIQSGSFSLNESKINATYNACIKFIKSYNY